MARVGISKTYSAGVLTDVTALFGILKQFIIDAGFYIVTNTATHIEFMPAGTTPAANTDDDTPHFHLYQTGTTQIHAQALYGLAWDDAGIRAGQAQLVVQTPVQYYDGADWFDADITFHAAADGREGWFWIASSQTQWDPDDEIETGGYHHVVVGTRATRLSADMTSGLACRYGIFENGGKFAPAYMKNRFGVVLANGTSVALGWWSPLTSNGAGAIRHAGSPLGPMVVPCYPEQDNDQLSHALFGQIQDVMIATDGYTHLGTTIPGWITYVSWLYFDCPFALRSPGTFTPV